MAIGKVDSVAPEIGFVITFVFGGVLGGGGAAIGGIHDAVRGAVGEDFGEGTIEEEKLCVGMMSGQDETGGTVEITISEDEFHVFVEMSVVPNAGGVFHFVEIAVGGVAPAAGADEIDGALEVAAGVVVTAAAVAPEGDGVGTGAEDIAVGDDGAISGSVDGEGVRADHAGGVVDGEILEDGIVAVDVDDASADGVGIFGEGVSVLGEFDAGSGSALALESDAIGIDAEFFLVDAVFDEDDDSLVVVGGD